MSGEHTHALPAHEHELPEHAHPGGSPLVTVAAADSPRKAKAAFRCTGTDDQEVIRRACAESPAVTLLSGTFRLSDTLAANGEYVDLGGQGRSTILQPTPDFPADQYVVSTYRDDRAPVGWAFLHNFHIEGIAQPQMVHGLRFCSYRGGLDRISIHRMTGDGLRVHNAPGTGATPKPWNSLESMFSHLNIGSCARYGLNAASTDQHWTDLVVHASGEANVYGSFSGSMIENFHFYAAVNPTTKKQTVDNVVLWRTNRTRWGNGKIEHAFKRLLYLHGDPKGGDMSFSNVGFRNGSGEGKGLHPQVLADRSGGNTWKLLFTGCPFDADVGQPSWNFQALGDCLRNSRMTGCTFEDAVSGDVTPVTGLTVV